MISRRGFVTGAAGFGGLAAFARLTEGHHPTCSIEWLAETVLGYAFTDRADTDSVIAIWDWGARGTVVELPVGRDEVEVADIMGISQSYISRLEKRIISRLRKEILKMS